MKPVLNKSKSLESLREKKLRSKYGKYTDKKVQAKKNIIKRNKSSNTLDINKIENKLYEAKKNFDLEWKMNQRFDKVDEALKDIKTTMNGMNDSIGLMENSVALMVGLSLYNSPLISEELKPKLTSKLNTQINKFVAGMDKEPNIINTNKKNKNINKIMETNIFNSKKYEEPKVKEKDEKPKKKFSFTKKIKKPSDNDSSKLSIQSLIKNTSESQNNENAIDCALWQADLNYSPYFVCGSYWTSSQFLDGNPVGVGNAVALKIVTYDMDPAYTSGFVANKIRCKGYSVRLVSDE